MIYDATYATWHRLLMGRDTDFAVATATTKSEYILMHYPSI